MKARRITILIICLLSGCVTPKYGQETQLILRDGSHPVWAIAPAVNLSGEPSVDPILQADLLFQQLQAVNNVTVIPVNRVVQVYAALHITQVESEEQAAIVCDQLGCDGLIIPTLTIYDPYNPPKMGAALQLMRRTRANSSANIDVRELSREATPAPTQSLPRPEDSTFVQVVGMYDSANGSVRDAVGAYAAGRNDPTGPLAASEYLVSMDRYSGFVYHTLIQQMLTRISGQSVVLPPQTAQSTQKGLTAQAD
jgi:hypothetical protein